MKQSLKIYIERLRGGKNEELSEKLEPSFMDISEKEVLFKEPIEVTGEAYLAEDWLILHLSIKTSVELQCALCCDRFRYSIDLSEILHEESLEDIREASYDILPLIRETILLEIPFYPQCGGTKCNNRQELENFLKKETIASDEKKGTNGHKPFQDIL